MFFSAQEFFWLRGWQDNTYGPQRPIDPTNNASIGSVAWATITNASDVDGQYATVSWSTTTAASNYLTVADFDFVIPTGAIITGIRADIVRSASISPGVTDNIVQIVKGGTITGTNQASSTPWPTSDAIMSYGGYGDLWGQTWTASDISSPTFGLALSVINTVSPAVASVDSIKLLVWYFI